MQNISYTAVMYTIVILWMGLFSLAVFSQGVQAQALPSSSLGQSCADDSHCQGEGERCDYEKSRCGCRAGFHVNIAKTHCITVESYGEEVCDMRFPGSVFNTDRKRCECPAGTRKGSDGRSCIGTPLAPPGGTLEKSAATVSISITPSEETGQTNPPTKMASAVPKQTAQTPGAGSTPLQSLENAARQARQSASYSPEVDSKTDEKRKSNDLQLQPSTKREFKASPILYVLTALLAGACAWWFFRKRSGSARTERTGSKNSVRSASPKKSMAGTMGKSLRIPGWKGAPYAGFWIRFGAMILDYVILGIPFSIVFALAFFASPWLSPLVSVGLGVLVLFLEGVKGGTPGKLIIGLRITTEQGNAIGIPRALLRNVGKALSSMVFGIGFFMIAWTAKKQGLHDMIAGTVVVSTR